MSKPRLGMDPFAPPSGVDALIQDTREKLRQPEKPSLPDNPAPPEKLEKPNPLPKPQLLTPPENPNKPYHHSRFKKQRFQSKQSSSSSVRLRPGWTRGSFIIREDLLEMVRDHSYWARVEIKHIIDEALLEYFKKIPSYWKVIQEKQKMWE